MTSGPVRCFLIPYSTRCSSDVIQTGECSIGTNVAYVCSYTVLIDVVLVPSRDHKRLILPCKFYVSNNRRANVNVISKTKGNYPFARNTTLSTLT